MRYMRLVVHSILYCDNIEYDGSNGHDGGYRVGLVCYVCDALFVLEDTTSPTHSWLFSSTHGLRFFNSILNESNTFRFTSWS